MRERGAMGRKAGSSRAENRGTTYSGWFSAKYNTSGCLGYRFDDACRLFTTDSIHAIAFELEPQRRSFVALEVPDRHDTMLDQSPSGGLRVSPPMHFGQVITR